VPSWLLASLWESHTDFQNEVVGSKNEWHIKDKYMFLSYKYSRCLFLFPSTIPRRISQMPRMAYTENRMQHLPLTFSKRGPPTPKDKWTGHHKNNSIGRNWNSKEYQNIPTLQLVQRSLCPTTHKESKHVTGCTLQQIRCSSSPWYPFSLPSRSFGGLGGKFMDRDKLHGPNPMI